MVVVSIEVWHQISIEVWHQMSMGECERVEKGLYKGGRP